MTMIWLKRSLFALAALLVAGGVFYAFQPKPVLVETVPARREEFVEWLEEDGVTRVREPYLVSAPVSGSVSRIGLHTGDRVTHDQIIATLRPAAAPLLDAQTRSELSARLRAAEDALGQAKATEGRALAVVAYSRSDLARVRQLVANGSVPKVEAERAEMESLTHEKELASASAAARMAAHEVELARITLQRSSGGHAGDEWALRAATDGTVLRVLHESEGVVAAGTPVLELGDLSDLEIALDVLTTDAVRIPIGGEVVIERWGGEKPLRGRVTKLGSSAHTKISSLGVEEQRVDATVELLSPRAEWAALGDGYRVRGRVVLARQPDALVVPTSALFRRGDGWAVFVVSGGRAAARSISVGRRNGTAATVEKGLAAGDAVVRHPSDELADGARVELRKITALDAPGG
jgi:HlyD family secretion protein